MSLIQQQKVENGYGDRLFCWFGSKPWNNREVKLLKTSKRINGSDILQEIQAGICREIHTLAIPVILKQLSWGGLK